MKRFCDIPQPSSRHRFLLPQTPDDLLFREARSSWAPRGRFPHRPVDHPLEPLYSSHSNGARPACGPDSLHRNLRRSFAAGVQCLGGLLLLLRTNIESIERKMKVHVADRRVLMPDHDLFGFPGKKASEDRVSIIIWRDADPVAGLEAGVLCL